jgi:hypothetical protein
LSQFVSLMMNTLVYICAKGICDRSCSFEIIDQKACRRYGDQDSSGEVCALQSYVSSGVTNK